MEPIDNAWPITSQKIQERLNTNRTQLVEAWYHQMPKDLSGNLDENLTRRIESLRTSKGVYVTMPQKTPVTNMSYIPHWVAAGSGGGHYPPHMISPQQPAAAHSPQPAIGSSSPLGSPSHMYQQSLSPLNKNLHNPPMIVSQSELSPKSSHSNMAPSSPPPSVITTTSVSQAAAVAAAATAAAVAAAVAASSPNSGSSSPPISNHTNHGAIEPAYHTQAYSHRALSPSKAHIKPEIPSLHSLPELALGLAGPSAFDPKGHRKYVRSRSPGKYPAPEQLSSPVMYSYQGRGRPRKHFTHSTGLPTMVPVTHPSSAPSPEDNDDEENKPFKCNMCTKGFKLRGGLQQHERTHSTDRPYICPDCGKLFRQPTHLQQHMRIHTGEKPYDCTFCDKSFRQRTILNQHLRIHTGEKPYICMECGKQFRQKAILDQHYRTHLGEKPYACPHPSCRKHFREMASLISHMKCHKDVPDPKIVIQQAKRLIKEEKLDEFGHHENNGISGGGGVEVLTIPHPGSSTANHDGPNSRDHNSNRFNNGDHQPILSARSYPSPSPQSASSSNQRSPHSLHAQQGPQQPQQPQQAAPSSNNTESQPLSQSTTQTIASGMMAATTPQMAMANLIPYPHSIFPAAASYMMSPDPRTYQISSGAISQGASSASSSTSANQHSPLQTRPGQ